MPWLRFSWLLNYCFAAWTGIPEAQVGVDHFDFINTYKLVLVVLPSFFKKIVAFIVFCGIYCFELPRLFYLCCNCQQLHRAERTAQSPQDFSSSGLSRGIQRLFGFWYPSSDMFSVEDSNSIPLQLHGAHASEDISAMQSCLGVLVG